MLWIAHRSFWVSEPRDRSTMSSSADEDSLFQALGTSCYERICQLAMDKDVEDRQMIHLSTHTCIEDVETHENLLRHLMKVSGKSMSKPALVCKCFERLDACNDYNLFVATAGATAPCLGQVRSGQDTHFVGILKNPGPKSEVLQ